MYRGQLEVGQKFKTKIGYVFTIIGINTTHFCWQMDDGELGCTPLKWWPEIQEPVLIN